MKVLFIGNEARSSYIFWSKLMQNIQRLDHDVVCCVPHENNKHYIKALQAQGVRVITYALERKGTNVIKDIKSLWALYDILRQEKPDKIFTSAIKPVIYGNIAARTAQIKDVFSCITGLGFSFEQDGGKLKRILHELVKFLYKLALCKTKIVFFQNESDKEFFLQNKIISKKTKAIICNGTGVDVDYFALQKKFPKQITFLMIGRLIKAKGIKEFVQAAKIIKQKHTKVSFKLLGPKELGHGAMDFNKIKKWQKEGCIEYLGESHDVRPYITDASVIVLPSYREGLSCALMEAMSMGRPVVASEVPGCKELIKHGKNGYLVPARHYVALANALERFILEPHTIKPMGLEARRMVENDFEANKVALHLMQHMNIMESNNSTHDLSKLDARPKRALNSGAK